VVYNLKVEEKADRRGLFIIFYALGPMMKMTMEEVDFTLQHSLEVSQWGSCERIKPVLKAVSSSPMF
jgi:hypothetical protein